jgi:CRISPR-associated protein Csx3
MSEIRVEVISTDQNFQILNVLITGNGLTSPSILNDIKIPNNLDPTKGVVVYGKGPIWLHSYLVHECHHTSWVATFDPRKGGVVVQTHSENGPFVGDIIPSEQINQYIKKQAISKKSYQFENKKKKIAFLGPPHRGKSVFM